MQMGSSIVSFDTAAHNRLVDEGQRSQHILSALKSKFFFRLLGLAYEELASTPDPTRRLAFVNDCRALQAERWDCLYPHNEVLKLLVKAHNDNPATFDWLAVDVRSGELNHEIRSGQCVLDDALSEQQRQEQKELLKRYKRMWADQRPAVDKVLEAEGKSPPTTFKNALAEHGSRFLLSVGKLLYDGGLSRMTSEVDSGVRFDTSVDLVKHFIDNCPPFRAFLYASFMSWYHHSARHQRLGERFRSGRNDLFMSVYLPYCDIFVTAERKGEQERCLREIASLLSPRPEIIAYDDFVDCLLINGSTNTSAEDS